MRIGKIKAGKEPPVSKIKAVRSTAKITLAAAIIMSLAFMLTACGQKNEEANQRYTFAMNTVMELEAYGDNTDEGLEAALKEINRLDGLLSTETEGSEIWQLNHEGRAAVSEDTRLLLERAADIYESTGGKFDISVYPLSSLWGFINQEYYLPADAEIQAILPSVDGSAIEIKDDGTAILNKEGMKVTLGGIAKGYTSSRIMEIFKEHGIEQGAVSLGGNVQTLGKRPDGKDWRVSIRNPEDTETVIGTLNTSDEAVITSGAYERYFEQDGITYGHILDPETGYPAESGLLSVTIVSGDGTLADALSTSLYVMGIDDASDYWRAHSDEFDFIIEDEAGVIYLTSGVADRFETDHETVTVQ